jgi:tetratricopeptide (TPR) repeat protein
LLEEAIGDADTVAADLERSLQAGVIELEGEHVRFTHPLLASLCYTDASPLQRRRVHARLAAIVDDPEGRARHVALAADGEDEDVARSLEEAAERAVGRGATQAATELWELATAFTPPERADEHRRRRRATAESRLQAGDLAGAVALLQPLVNETSAGADRAELLLLLAMARDDDLVESIKLCEEVLELSVGDHRLQSRAHQVLATELCEQGDIRTALVHLRQAAALAERAGDDELLTAALGPASTSSSGRVTSLRAFSIAPSNARCVFPACRPMTARVRPRDDG